ncbi:DUF1413 domain-containing protein [Plesiomonas shigelloides]|uniref:DUF1413 domain-containing protein n=1 Tax=Plesiomonas shigelloides TaxID=703 RepID=UPI000D91F02B|nr:DUF1413 domain-containing protein [Plesiomonas shigelloides]KAB7672711.1 DUF1413 domain-containing protein [Plesiomonas shigelloides]QIY10190.1 DUF1413 domain-containing protein [Plesiomonas shigelloides]SPZ37440.1 Domain of uncharacterised function (DUF1413) [Plesiomonas shigelloides]SUB63610.1 Domain of uncharacterised function (DUF1413) [Plesiomonas shigelloides]
MKKAITIRLEEYAIQKLEFSALKKEITRQELIESIILDAVKSLDFPDELQLIPESILETIKQKLKSLAIDSEISFKGLLSPSEWQQLSDVQKRNYGKQIKKLVENGDIPELEVGRKKSNNEQQYRVIK